MKRLRNNILKGLVVSLVFLLLGFLLGKFKQNILLDKMRVMNADMQALQITHEQLQSDFFRLKISSVVETQTIKNLLQHNQSIQEELSIVNNKNFFYERIIAPELDGAGVDIYSFKITKNHHTKQWDYQLVLIQSQKGRHFLKGKLKISFAVSEGENVKNIKLDELTDKLNSRFKFKYFQRMKGSFSLPEEIVVDLVIIQLNVAGSSLYRAQNIEQRYDWHAITTPNDNDSSEFGNNVNSRH
ncbi:MAG: DUF6776 family protein [Psychromonas sp.]